MNQEKNIVVMAGNPLFKKTDEGFFVDAQPVALGAALKFVKENRSSVSKIYITVDHLGSFVQQFVDSTRKFSVKQLKHITLAMLHPEIQYPYADLLKTFEVSADEIFIIIENHNRNDARRSRDKYSIWRNNGCGDGQKECGIDRVNCNEITAETVHRMSRHGTILRLFWQFDPIRCRPAVMKGGTRLARDIYDLKEFDILNIMLNDDGEKTHIQ